MKLLTFEPLGPAQDQPTVNDEDSILTLDGDYTALHELLLRLKADGAESFHLTGTRSDGTTVGDYTLTYS
jgi:hypothetical protein